MIRYTNYLTTPFGKECSLREIKNEEYMVLLKFIEAKDYSGFYHALDEIVKETVPNFEEYNIIEKAYIYLALCFYSVHSTIVTQNTPIGPIEYSVGHFFESIDSCCSQIQPIYLYDLSQAIKAELTIPTRLIITHSDITIDYSTGLSKIKDIVFKNEEEKCDFFKQISPKLAVQLEREIKKRFDVTCNFFNDININLLDPDVFYFIFQIFAERLEDFYELLYYSFEYLKWSWDTFKSFTPIETRIMFNQFKLDKERQAQQRQQSLNT